MGVRSFRKANGSTKILIVDDDPSVREAFYEILSTSGYSVITVDGGKEAMDRMEGEHFDLLITDFRMNDMSGGTLLRKMREKKIPTTALVISGNIPPSEEEQLKQLGALEILTKPVSLPYLLQAVHRGVTQ